MRYKNFAWFRRRRRRRLFARHKWLEKQFLTLLEITRRRVREYKEYNDDNNTNTITFHLV